MKYKLSPNRCKLTVFPSQPVSGSLRVSWFTPPNGMLSVCMFYAQVSLAWFASILIEINFPGFNLNFLIKRRTAHDFVILTTRPVNTIYLGYMPPEFIDERKIFR